MSRILHVEGMSEAGRAAKVVTDKFLKKNEAIKRIEYALQAEKTYKTLQLGMNEHALLLDELVYLNHSCNPNVYFKNDLLYALRDIAIGEELTFFYPSTEWEMREPFDCQCESLNCIKTVKGACALPKDVLDSFYISEHIKNLLKTREK
eukprot:NODE_135_length_18075_cov_0.518413.p11 type:complete len:149 gc:universal NODE_135_length_18075_cov_0.518413:14330-14776(+)